MKKSIGLLVLCLAITYSIGIAGNFFSSDEINSQWYQSVKPDITPPNITFPIVWNVLFLLIGVSWWIALRKADKHHKGQIWMSFIANLIFNLLWSVFYFGMHNILLAFIDSVLILGTIVWMMSASFKSDERATWLLVPYLLWVSFATLLTYISLIKTF